mgnify:FL=1
MVAANLWQLWEPAWDEQGFLARVFEQAQLLGGIRVTSHSYSRLETRNGSMVLLQHPSRTAAGLYAAEVDYFVQLQLPEADSSGTGAGSSRSSRVQTVAMVRLLKTKPQREDAASTAVAGVLLEAYADTFEQQHGVDRVWAVPLEHILAALDACCTICDGRRMLTLTPVVGRSKRVPFS